MCQLLFKGTAFGLVVKNTKRKTSCGLLIFSPTAESDGVSDQIGSGVVRGGSEVRFRKGSASVLRGFRDGSAIVPGKHRAVPRRVLRGFGICKTHVYGCGAVVSRAFSLGGHGGKTHPNTCTQCQPSPQNRAIAPPYAPSPTQSSALPAEFASAKLRRAKTGGPSGKVGPVNLPTAKTNNLQVGNERFLCVCVCAAAMLYLLFPTPFDMEMPP